MKQKTLAWFKANKYQLFAWLFAFVLLAAPVAATFAQSTTTLEINSSDITNNLFTGANIIIGALLAVVMLVAGFKFGRGILEDIVASITKR